MYIFPVNIIFNNYENKHHSCTIAISLFMPCFHNCMALQWLGDTGTHQQHTCIFCYQESQGFDYCTRKFTFYRRFIISTFSYFYLKIIFIQENLNKRAGKSILYFSSNFSVYLLINVYENFHWKFFCLRKCGFLKNHIHIFEFSYVGRSYCGLFFSNPMFPIFLQLPEKKSQTQMDHI